MRAPHAAAVSARIEVLIARHYGGDRTAAAASLGIEPESVTDLLSGDWSRFTLSALAALVRRHQVSARLLLESSAAQSGTAQLDFGLGESSEHRAQQTFQET